MKGSMDAVYQLVVFNLDDRRYAVRLAAVKQIVRIAEISLLPKAPEIVLGVINVKGRVIPVINVRRRFGLPDREIKLSDQIIIASTTTRAVALVVDAATGVVERSEDEMIAASTVLPGLEYVEGVVKLEDGLILIHDLSTFLSLDEEKTLEQAMTDT